MNKVHFSSSKMDWKTPNKIYEELHKEFNFDFDPCPENPTFDGLNIEWGNSNFVNPPYGRKIYNWIKKGYEQSRSLSNILNGKGFFKNKTVVFLVPSRTDTKWWHDYCMKAKEIRFIKGRLKFQGAKNSAPFPSCIVIFN